MAKANPLTAPNSSPEANTSNGIILFTATLALFFLTNIFSASNIALPAIASEFKADAILLNWVVTSSLLTSAVLLIPFGRLSDIIGIRKMYGYGMILYTITSAISALSTTITMLIVIRAIQGISIAMVIGNSTAMISSAFPAGKRGRALGLASASVFTGLSAGPFLGGVLTEHLGWRSIFIINIPIGLIVVLLVFWKIKSEWRGARGENFDLMGSIIFSLAFVAMMYGFSALPAIISAPLIIAGILGLLGFLKWETRVKSPILNLKIFRNNRAFIYSNLASLINYAATFAIVFLMSLYLQYIKGLSPQTAGLIMMAQPATQACLSPVTGRLSDRIEPRIMSSIGTAITCLSLILFSFLNQNTSTIGIIALFLLLGLGLALFVSPNTNAIMSSVEPKIYGVASAVANTMRQIGQMLSMGITMIMLAVFMGRVVITPEYYPAFVTSMHISFAIFAVFSFGAIFFSLARGKVH